MEHLILILAAALTLIGAAFSKLLADEFKAWAPSLISSILAIAVRALPPARRERSEEEWKSHVNELAGDLSKVIAACGCIFAAWKIAAEPFAVSKRVFDVTLAFVGIVLLAPLLIVIFVATATTTPGPVLFRHRRMGRHGKPIDLFKFRTMVMDAPERLHRLLNSDPAAAAEWMTSGKLQHDPRVTALGYILRKSALDELPQFFNVLKGDMSIVGPRPITDKELERYSSAVDAYLSCRPGMTGLWQISRRSGNAYDKRIACDRFYARNWSMMLDAKIMFLTIPAFLVDDCPLVDDTPPVLLKPPRLLRLVLFDVFVFAVTMLVWFH
jgi:exopolysaccharide production protein ExoY